MERITKEDVSARVRNVNRRLNPGKSPMDYQHYLMSSYRNGYCALDEYQGRTTCVRTLTVGTKREVADFLHAMMVGIDLAQQYAVEAV